MKNGRTRGPSAAMIVAVLALVMAMVGTGFAASALTKKQKKQVRNIVNGAFAGRVMAAAIPQGNSCAIGSQTGGISAARVGTDGVDESCDVTFPRNVANCVVGATPMHPLQDIGGQASVRPLGGAVVRVTRINETNTFRDAGLVSIFAVCPA
jgi:hypothetical protein